MPHSLFSVVCRRVLFNAINAHCGPGLLGMAAAAIVPAALAIVRTQFRAILSDQWRSGSAVRSGPELRLSDPCWAVCCSTLLLGRCLPHQ
ncbi:hypothetical protein BQ8482_130065 [Mesorhizobium delmotii]|uniref:Uncharacterized protein n=1 Tax=Mesorhizobium delmotii TaxID=1631247 RepID=A0A2P9AGD6_9HYPH|nr:hypothetical protein BQ8482_130065 [Mesorhizobium delmotii]